MNESCEEKLKQAAKRIRELEEALARRDGYIKTTFGPYLSNEVLEEILREKDTSFILGERRKVGILYSDIRDSTLLSEKMEATAFVRMLNHFLVEMIEIINSWQGNILDFVGDAIVVVFGAPRENEYSARDAVACAVAMQRRMGAVNEWNQSQGYPEISMGIGIHFGEAILGNIGSPVRTKYDMIGRNVNLASRIEGYTQGGQILISSEVLQEAGEQVIVNKEDCRSVRPKGIQEDILLYDVIGFGRQRLKEQEACQTIGWSSCV